MIELLEEAGGELVSVAFLAATALGVFVEISPIKINPWSALFKWIGNAFNKGLKEELALLKGYVKELEKLVDMNEIKRIRAEIFAFEDSLRLGVKHTKDNFMHIFDIHDDYMKLLEKYDMENGRMTAAFDYITDVYRECMERNILI